MKRWEPRIEPTKKEQAILKRLTRTRKLFAFLRRHRHELMDASFQDELAAMYRDTGAGDEPLAPAMLCMAVILQGYMGVSDAEAVELSLLDLRWQMVLDNMTSEEPAFSQGTLQRFRKRLIEHDLDRRLLERTIELAKNTAEFDWKKLPKDLRIAVDSRPLEGAGRVEDTFNLLGHAARKLARSAAHILERKFTDVCRDARTPLLAASSIKAGLDINWNDPEQKDAALETLFAEVTRLSDWLEREQVAMEHPLRPYIDAIAQIQTQDLERDGHGRVQIRRGVVNERRVSIEEPEMRHGRKSKTKRFNGYKEHIAASVDTKLIHACTITPANRPEEQAAPDILADLRHQGAMIGELHIDRGYVNSELVDDIQSRRGTVLCKPWRGGNSNVELFGKAAFKLNMRDGTITCPAGQVERFEPGATVHFDPEACGGCPLRANCTNSASGRGRSVHIAADEKLQQKLRKLSASSKGRARLRERSVIEHGLAHISARKGPKARYIGTRNNVFDLRRAATIQNLETIQRVSCSAA